MTNWTTIHKHGKLLLAIFGLLGALLTAQPAFAEGFDGAYGCGTHDRWMAKIIADKSVQSPEACTQYGSCDEPGVRNTWIPEPDESITTVRLVVHVLRSSSGANPIVSDATVDMQVAHLNADYLPSRIQFEHTINHVDSDTWRFLPESEINNMKRATAIAPDSQLNVWVTYVLFDYSFGTFPWDGDARSSTGGIVMGHFHFGTSPNSTFAHEVGHCLGLYHTFRGVEETTQCGPCYEYVGAPDADLLGDFCFDTPAQPVHYSCSNASGRDDCSGELWGYTQPENFMAYTPDFCQNMFTEQQNGRMRCWIDSHLPDWVVGVKFSAANTFGPAPLEVTFDATSNKTVNSWDWSFGDGEYSAEEDPVHTYDQPGYHTVEVTVDTPDGPYTSSRPGLVSVYADTLRVDTVRQNPDASYSVDLYLRNYLPVEEIFISFGYSGPIDLKYDGHSVTGLRTEYFDTHVDQAHDAGGKRGLIRLLASNDGTLPPLEPGNGPILSLLFHDLGSSTSGTNPINIISFAGHTVDATTPGGSFTLESEDGFLSLDNGCCLPPTVGDVDQSGSVDITDISVFIDNQFLTLTPLVCDDEGDIDFSGVIDVTDLSLLIDNQFLSLTPLSACP